MTDPLFVDTNVWVYAVDGADPVKRDRALEVTAPARGRDLVVSTQVMTEFYAVVTRKIEVPLSTDEAEAMVRQLALLPVVGHRRVARRLCDRWQSRLGRLDLGCADPSRRRGRRVPTAPHGGPRSRLHVRVSRRREPVPSPALGLVARLVLRHPGRSSLLEERAQALLALGARALARDRAGRVPLARCVRQAAHLAHDRLGGASGRRACGQQIGERRPRRLRSSASSPSTTSCTSPIRRARVASKRRPTGKSARACVSPILAMTKGLMTAGRMPRRVSVKPNFAPASAMTRSLTAQSPMPPPSAAPWTRATTGAGQ